MDKQIILREVQGKYYLFRIHLQKYMSPQALFDSVTISVVYSRLYSVKKKHCQLCRTLRRVVKCINNTTMESWQCIS